MLLYSEFAGCAQALRATRGAVIVNPYDTEGVAHELHRYVLLDKPKRVYNLAITNTHTRPLCSFFPFSLSLPLSASRALSLSLSFSLSLPSLSPASLLFSHTHTHTHTLSLSLPLYPPERSRCDQHVARSSTTTSRATCTNTQRRCGLIACFDSSASLRRRSAQAPRRSPRHRCHSCRAQRRVYSSSSTKAFLSSIAPCRSL